MSFTEIAIILIGALIFVIFWIYKYISPKTTGSNISVSFILCFNLICFFTVYCLPIIFYKLSDSIPYIFLKILVLIVEAFSVNICFSILNGILVKKMKTDIEVNVKNRIYLLTVIYAFIILFVFLIKTYIIYDDFLLDDDFYDYLIAPLSIIIGNLLPLKSSYSKEGMKVEIKKNWKDEYSFKKVDKELVFYSRTISHIINIFWFCFFLINKIESFDHILILVAISAVISAIIMYFLYLIDKK